MTRAVVDGAYDVVVVGGGHNGLVAAAYLARAGLRVVVLERRDRPGGLAARLEYFPGYTAAITNSPGSLEPQIVADLGLADFGLRFVRPDPALVFPFPDAPPFVGWRDPGRVHEELRKYSARDSARYDAFFDYLRACSEVLDIDMFAPPPAFRDVVAGVGDARQEALLATALFGSIGHLVEEWFESSEVRALVASTSVASSLVSPRTPGTVFRPLLRYVSQRSRAARDQEDPRRSPLRGSTGLPIGGMGSIPEAICRSIAAAGGEVRTGAEVVEVTTNGDRATGVALAGGEEIRAGVVVSSVNPKTTLLAMLPDDALPAWVREELGRVPMRGSAFKLGLALSDMPRLAGFEDRESQRRAATCQFRIAPSLRYMQDTYEDAVAGRLPERPILMGLTPSMADSSLAPEGRHVMSVNVFHVPYELAEGTWDEARDRFGKHCVDVLTEYIPNLGAAVEDARFWSPRDLEAEYGLLGANITHGDMLPGTMLGFRPVAGVAQYRTPVTGLYLCGAGTWPGGFVSGLPGHNASRQVMDDLSARVHAGAGSLLPTRPTTDRAI